MYVLRREGRNAGYVFPFQDFVRSKRTSSNITVLNFNEIGRILPISCSLLSRSLLSRSCIRLYPITPYLILEITVNTDSWRILAGSPRLTIGYAISLTFKSRGKRLSSRNISPTRTLYLSLANPHYPCENQADELQQGKRKKKRAVEQGWGGRAGNVSRYAAHEL